MDSHIFKSGVGPHVTPEPVDFGDRLSGASPGNIQGQSSGTRARIMRSMPTGIRRITFSVNCVRAQSQSAEAGRGAHHQLMRMSDQMQTLFEADSNDKTGEAAEGCKIIHEMGDILKRVRRKS